MKTGDLFGANRGPRPSVDGLVSVDGLGPRLAPNRSENIEEAENRVKITFSRLCIYST